MSEEVKFLNILSYFLLMLNRKTKVYLLYYLYCWVLDELKVVGRENFSKQVFPVL